MRRRVETGGFDDWPDDDLFLLGGLATLTRSTPSRGSGHSLLGPQSEDRADERVRR